MVQYLQEQRKMVLNQIKNTFVELQKKINKNPDTKFIDRQKLVSEICQTYGNRKEKAQEYIQELIDAEFIAVDKYSGELEPGRMIKIGYQEQLDG